MTYEYECITGGVFRFTVPGEGRTVELFRGSKIIVAAPLTGSYLKLLRLVREIPAPVVETPIAKVVETPIAKVVAKKATPKAKVADKITAVTEIPEVETDEVEVEVNDAVVKVAEKATKPAPKRTAKKKNS